MPPVHYHRWTRIYNDPRETKLWYRQSEGPHEYHVKQNPQYQAGCPENEILTASCDGFYVGPKTVDTDTQLTHVQPTRLNYQGYGRPQIALHGTAPYKARGWQEHVDANSELRPESNPDRWNNVMNRAKPVETSYNDYRFYNLDQCPVTSWEPWARGGVSTRADLRNHVQCATHQRDQSQDNYVNRAVYVG